MQRSAPGAGWQLSQLLAGSLLEWAFEPWGVVVLTVVGQVSMLFFLGTLERRVWESAIANTEDVVNINISHKSVELVKQVHAGIGRVREIGTIEVTLERLELIVKLNLVE